MADVKPKLQPKLEIVSPASIPTFVPNAVPNMVKSAVPMVVQTPVPTPVSAVAPTVVPTASSTGVPAGALPAGTLPAAAVPPMVQTVTPLDTQATTTTNSAQQPYMTPVFYPNPYNMMFYPPPYGLFNPNLTQQGEQTVCQTQNLEQTQYVTQFSPYAQMPYMTVPIVQETAVQPIAQEVQPVHQEVMVEGNGENVEITTTINGDSYDELIKIVWQREFNQLFCQLPEKPVAKWNFYESPTPKDDNIGLILRDWAKVRFSCPVCGNGWTSMRGMVQFHISLHNAFLHHGQVVQIGVIVATMFGQKCQKCMDNRFEVAMWYPEEVAKVLHNLYVRVRHHFYGDIDLIQKLRVDRRPGNPRNRHRPELCQACANGKCKMK